MPPPARHPSEDDFQGQLDAIEELGSIDNRLRWVQPGGIERFLLTIRRRQLVRQISAWNRRLADDDVEGHQRRA